MKTELVELAKDLLSYNYIYTYIYKKTENEKIEYNLSCISDLIGVQKLAVQNVHSIDEIQGVYVVNGICGIIAILIKIDDVIYCVHKTDLEVHNKEYLDKLLEYFLENRFKIEKIESELKDLTRKDLFKVVKF